VLLERTLKRLYRMKVEVWTAYIYTVDYIQL